MSDKTVVVGSTIGLHSRPARVIAAAAQQFDDAIVLSHNGQSVLAESPLLIMTLGAEYGAVVTVSSENPEATDTIASLIEQELSTAPTEE